MKTFEPDPSLPIEERYRLLEAHHVEETTELLRQRDEAREWVRRMHREARTLTCVYCGHAYPPGTPASGSEALTAHIRTCEKHPLRAAEVRIGTLEAWLRRHGEHDKWSLVDVEAGRGYGYKCPDCDLCRLLGDTRTAGQRLEVGAPTEETP